MAGIYIHIPFCKQACYYCDFHFSTSLRRKSEMAHAICREIQLRKLEITEIIETIYFGGGTPSLLSEEEIQQILDSIRNNFSVAENPEITLEANPDDLTESKIMELSKSPINRLSIGIQSFFDDDLKMMNRAHQAQESIDCLSVATRHFENITVDLIYGIPKMTIEKWQQNLQSVFDFGIPHISSYALTVEPKTALDSFIKNGKYPPLDEALAAQHFDVLVEESAKNGFTHYETSNFGKTGFFSKHNMSYWQGIPYLGFGPSAHSYNENKRSWNSSNNTNYMKSIAQNALPANCEVLSIKDQLNEYIMTGLRTIWGVSLLKVERDFGIEHKNKLLQDAQKFIDHDLLVIASKGKHSILRTTKKGKFLADGIASDLFII